MVTEVDLKLNKKKDKKKKKIEKETGFTIIRINPDKEDFDDFAEIGRIQNYIAISTRKIARKSAINDVKRLLKALSEFKNNDIISKFARNFVKHLLPTLQRGN